MCVMIVMIIVFGDVTDGDGRSLQHDFITQNLWSAHEEAISICEDQGLHQAIYFLRRDLNFIKEVGTDLSRHETASE